MRRMDDLLLRVGPTFTNWQRSLAARPRDLDDEEARLAHARRQQTLVNALDEGATALASYLRGRLGLDLASPISAPPFPRESLTPREFREAPRELEAEFARAWDGHISPADASKPLFWALCHIEWLEQGRFGSDRMHAFFTEGGGRGDTLDSRIRTFLRRMGGLPHVRGNVSVFTDCPLARAWWRVRIADEVAQDPDVSLSGDEAHDVLRAAGQVWNELAQMGLQRTTAINQPRARAALIVALAEAGQANQAAVTRTAQALARAASNRSLAHIPWAELRAIAHTAARVEALA